MPNVFVIRNQHGLYLSKQQEWTDGSDKQQLFRCAHRDEAINTVFEVSSRDITLRAEAVACPLDEKNQPLVESAGQLDFAADETVDEVIASDEEASLRQAPPVAASSVADDAG